MAVLLDKQPVPRSYSPTNVKPRLTSFVRRNPVSGIGSPIQYFPKALQSSSFEKKRPAPTPSSCAEALVNPKELKVNILSRFPTTQSLAFRLRMDRDHWRELYVEHEMQLLFSERRRKDADHAITNIMRLNGTLEAQLSDAVTIGEALLVRFKDAVTKQGTLVNALNEANRLVMQLKKSDRAKGKVWQRNLRLKAAIRSHFCRKHEGDKSVEAALQEALAVADARIEELEAAGEKLLDALDKRDASDESMDSTASEIDEGDNYDDCEGGKEENTELGLLEAEVAFRGVLDDSTYGEQKVLWGDLLES